MKNEYSDQQENKEPQKIDMSYIIEEEESTYNSIHNDQNVRSDINFIFYSCPSQTESKIWWCLYCEAVYLNNQKYCTICGGYK